LRGRSIEREKYWEGKLEVLRGRSIEREKIFGGGWNCKDWLKETNNSQWVGDTKWCSRSPSARAIDPDPLPEQG